MQINNAPQRISEIKRKFVKPPAYQWQDLALRIIAELSIPKHKKSAVFKVCRDYHKNFIERCLNDTKELAKEGERWKYFFKLISQEKIVKKNTIQ